MSGHRDDGSYAEDKAHHPNRKIMNTPNDYLKRYPRLLHALNMPDDRAINLIRRHQAGISTPNEQSILERAVSQQGRMMARSTSPYESYYDGGQYRPFGGSPDRAYEDY
jgi:hypothetical protein